MTAPWLALVVGNTRLHWGYFDEGVLSATWHTDHLSTPAAKKASDQPYSQNAWSLINDLSNQQGALPYLQEISSFVELWLASVVPNQTRLWEQAVSDVRIVRRSHIPLKNIYPTFGIDRAINLLGAKQTIGLPALVIDSGTALTLTAGVDDSVYGGAILPGLRLQLESLSQQTAGLRPLRPADIATVQKLPERWASDSEGAIASGIAYGLTSTCIDYITNWWGQFPSGAVVLTGGDGPLIYQYLNQRTPEIASRVLVDSDLMFAGMQVYRRVILES